MHSLRATSLIWPRATSSSWSQIGLDLAYRVTCAADNRRVSLTTRRRTFRKPAPLSRRLASYPSFGDGNAPDDSARSSALRLRRSPPGLRLTAIIGAVGLRTSTIRVSDAWSAIQWSAETRVTTSTEPGGNGRSRAAHAMNAMSPRPSKSARWSIMMSGSQPIVIRAAPAIARVEIPVPHPTSSARLGWPISMRIHNSNTLRKLTATLVVVMHDLPVGCGRLIHHRSLHAWSASGNRNGRGIQTQPGALPVSIPVGLALAQQ